MCHNRIDPVWPDRESLLEIYLVHFRLYHVPFPSADFVLCAFTVTNLNHECDHVLIPLSPLSESPNLVMVLGTPNADHLVILKCFLLVLARSYIFNIHFSFYLLFQICRISLPHPLRILSRTRNKKKPYFINLWLFTVELDTSMVILYRCWHIFLNHFYWMVTMYKYSPGS